MPALQAFVSIPLFWFSKFVMIDGGIIDDLFKKLDSMDALLIEKNN